MPDVSITEFAIIGLVVLIVFGPKRLPEISRKAGEWARELRSVSREFRRGLEREVAVINEPFQEIKKELVGPIDEIRKDLAGPIAEIKRDLESSVEGIEEDLAATAAGGSAAWVGPVAPMGPTPADALEDLDRIESGEELNDEDVD